MNPLSMKLSRAWLLMGLLYLAHGSMADSITFASPGNPIPGDGSLYSADPGPLVYNNTLYVIAGEDSAVIGDNSFVIEDWSLFSTSDPNPQGSTWTVQTKFLRPDRVFEWAAEGFAYASQIVVDPDGRFYLYAPVMQAGSTDKDGFGVGVAVAGIIGGPYTDAHPQGPIVSQSFPVANDIQNIDPTVLVEEDGIYMYWGTFGALKGVRLEEDMTTFASEIVDVNSLTGFFEAPWIMKRQSTYYMLYAANNAGPDSPCTPTFYHACIAYGTADSPLGPWTFQGVMLDIVSSTTSHPGAVQYGDQW